MNEKNTQNMKKKLEIEEQKAKELYNTASPEFREMPGKSWDCTEEIMVPVFLPCGSSTGAYGNITPDQNCHRGEEV